MDQWLVRQAESSKDQLLQHSRTTGQPHKNKIHRRGKKGEKSASCCSQLLLDPLPAMVGTKLVALESSGSVAEELFFFACSDGLFKRMWTTRMH